MTRRGIDVIRSSAGRRTWLSTFSREFLGLGSNMFGDMPREVAHRATVAGEGDTWMEDGVMETLCVV